MIKSLKLFAASVFVLFVADALAADYEAYATRTGGKSLSHWHGGPFFECRRAVPDDILTNEAKYNEDKLLTYWSFRPFYSQTRNHRTGEATYDFIWPLGTYRTRKDDAWWRAIIAYGDSRENNPSWSANVFPLWFSGADRFGKGYWGLFPFYGNHPHLLFMDDWSFIFWPIWQTYTVKGVRSKAVLWPFVTWRDAPREGVGVWPIVGRATQRESNHWYALWPFFTGASYYSDRDTSGAGHSLMCWPFYGFIRRQREKQFLFLPPFVSYAKTPSAVRWRMPWPFIEVLNSSVRDRISVWPLYEKIEGYSYKDAKKRKDSKGEYVAKPEEKTTRILWIFFENTELESDKTVEKRLNIFPFWTSESISVKDKKTGELKEISSYKRLWPFWSKTTKNGLSKERVLELNPIRNSEGFERNLSPFWTFWECEEVMDGYFRHSLFWSLFDWYSE
jgi:hypothetical protein